MSDPAVEELKHELSLARLQVQRYKAMRDKACEASERWHETALKLGEEVEALKAQLGVE